MSGTCDTVENFQYLKWRNPRNNTYVLTPVGPRPRNAKSSFELAQAQCYSGEESKLEGYASEIRSLSHSTATLKAGTSTKNWLVGWLMAWDVLVDIADVKTKCRVHFFGVKTWLVGWLVGDAFEASEYLAIF